MKPAPTSRSMKGKTFLLQERLTASDFNERTLIPAYFLKGLIHRVVSSFIEGIDGIAISAA